ncbi:MAG: DUF3857 domain-containing protein [Bacteroidia bacterium]|nr:DUF3857 domain-containing protein [Bacteroidia bacterium]
MKKIYLIFGIISFIAINHLKAQYPSSTPFGKIILEDFDETEYPDFEESDAVMLLNYRSVGFLPSVARPNMNDFVLKRYKILSKEGMKMSRQEFTLDSDVESLVDIKAATYQLNPRGEVISYKVKRNRIRKEKVGKNKIRYTVLLPVVRVGSIMEIQIQTQRKDYSRIPDWEFKADIPVLRAEHHAFLPKAFDYSRILKGDVTGILSSVVPFSLNPTNTLPVQSYSDPRSSRAQNRRSPMMLFGKHDILVMENLPALTKEDFSPTKLSYTPRVGYQLRRDVYYGNAGQRIFAGWGDFYNYTSRKNTEKKLKAKPKDWKESIGSRLDRTKIDDREFATRLIQIVQRQVKWDSSLNIYPKRLREVWDKRKGSGSEINMIACLLFREYGFNANPIYLSTVDHGEIQPRLPYLDQFNHIIFGVIIEDEMLLLDLVNGQRGLELLPERDLNQLGLMIGNEGFRWIPLRLQNPTIRYTYSRFKLNESGEMTGQIEELHRKQSIADAEKQLEELGKDPQAYWKKVQFSGLEETKFVSGNQSKTRSPESLKLICELSTNDFTEISTDVMIVQPMLIRQVKVNPFSQEKRTTPVDLTHPIRESHLFGLEIPDGYKVVQSPSPTKVILPNGGGSFVYNFTQIGNFVHVSSSIFLDQTLFLPQEYPNLKEFFKLIVSKHEEDIIIARKK